MANTITQSTIVAGQSRVVRQLQLVSDGTQETNLVLFDSSVIFASLGLTDTMNAKLEKVWITSSGSGTVFRGSLNYDATAPLIVVPFNGAASNIPATLDFSSFGGIPNAAGAGKTGDLTLTTAALAATSSLTIIYQMRLV